MKNKELNRLLVGRELEEAKNAYKKNVTFRILNNNTITEDSIQKRVNVMIHNGIITEVLGVF